MFCKAISRRPSLRRSVAGLLLVLPVSAALADTSPPIPKQHQYLFSSSALDLDPQYFSPAPASSATSPTGTGSPPRTGSNTQVNDLQVAFPNGRLGRSETTIAVDAAGLLMVAGWNDAQGRCGPPFNFPCTPQSPPGLSGYGFSSDGGRTWTDGGAPDPALFNKVFTRGDPWMDRGGLDLNTFFYANLAIHADTGARLGVSVHRGRFNGSSFAWEDAHVLGTGTPNNIYDKEAIAVAKDGSGAAYVSVTNFIERCGQPAFGFGQIEVWRTHDGGGTWDGPVVVAPDQTFITDPNQPGCGDTGVQEQTSVPAIGPGGEVYVVWQHGPTFNPAASTDVQIRFARSLDGGQTFSDPGVVARINSMWANAPVGHSRANFIDHPRIAVATTGPNKGRVYVSFYSAVSPVAVPPTVQSLVSSQAYLTYSDDQGRTWSNPLPVAATPPATGLKRFWPVVSVEPGGNVDVVYYESQEKQATADPSDVECQAQLDTAPPGVKRTGPNSSLVDTYWVRSTDGGASFKPPTRMSSETSNWCTARSDVLPPNFGDYIGSASGGNRAFPVWTDSRDGVPEVYFAQGLGAGKSPQP